jgi:hypothetical protein
VSRRCCIANAVTTWPLRWLGGVRGARARGVGWGYAAARCVHRVCVSLAAHRTVGQFVRELLVNKKYFGTMLPPIPVPVMKLVDEAIKRFDDAVAEEQGAAAPLPDRSDRRYALCPPRTCASSPLMPSVRLSSRSPDRGRDYDRDRGSDRERERDRARDYDRDRERERDRGSDRERDRGGDRDRGSERARDYDRDRDRNRGRDYDRDRGSDRGSERDRERERERYYDRGSSERSSSHRQDDRRRSRSRSPRRA